VSRVSTGIQGLDDILDGGFLPSRTYVVRGKPGVGKTISGMHFLNAGLKNGESTLCISFEQTAAEILADAKKLGFKLENAAFLDLTPTAETFTEMQTYDIFSVSEVERDPLTKIISAKIGEVSPKRLFIDGFSQFGRLASDVFHFRRLIQSFCRFATQSGATLLVSSDETDSARDHDIQSVADGVVNLDWSGALRTVHVSKFRGSDFVQGAHVMRITGAGIVVFPLAA
jgi:circadian clock protein KaiC